MIGQDEEGEKDFKLVEAMKNLLKVVHKLQYCKPQARLLEWRLFYIQIWRRLTCRK